MQNLPVGGLGVLTILEVHDLNQLPRFTDRVIAFLRRFDLY